MSLIWYDRATIRRSQSRDVIRKEQTGPISESSVDFAFQMLKCPRIKTRQSKPVSIHPSIFPVGDLCLVILL